MGGLLHQDGLLAPPIPDGCGFVGTRFPTHQQAPQNPIRCSRAGSRRTRPRCAPPGAPPGAPHRVAERVPPVNRTPGLRHRIYRRGVAGAWQGCDEGLPSASRRKSGADQSNGLFDHPLCGPRRGGGAIDGGVDCQTTYGPSTRPASSNQVRFCRHLSCQGDPDDQLYESTVVSNIKGGTGAGKSGSKEPWLGGIRRAVGRVPVECACGLCPRGVGVC